MSIILNIAILSLCLIWLYNSNKKNGELVGIVFTYLGALFIAFLISLAIENEYLDGLNHLLIAGGSSILFWLLSIVLLIAQTDNFSLSQRVGKISIMSIAFFIPLFIYLFISNTTFKIGG